MQNLDVEKELTLEEIQHFFSKNKEYVVEQEGLNIKITYNEESILEYKPTYQTLIRAITHLAYLGQ